ncbi:MAG: PAS domain-containing protein [Pseudomonadales bacterium]
MGERIRTFDWAAVGEQPLKQWPQGLQTALDILLGSNQAMLMVLGPQRRLLYNDPATALLGSRHPSALGQPLFNAWPELRDDLAPPLEQACAGQAAWLDHVRLRTHGRDQAEERLFSLALSPLRDDAGQPLGAFCTCNEISRQSPVRDRLRYAMRTLDLAWQTARGAMYEHAVPVDGSMYHAERWADLLGYPHEELPAPEAFLGWLFERIHPDDQPVVQRHYREFIEGHAPFYRVEARLRHRQGHWIWVRGVNAALERNPEGRVSRLVGMVLDITDLKETEAALRDSEARFREMADGMPVLVSVHDATGQVELVNQTLCAYFDVGAEDLRRDGWVHLVHPDDAEHYVNAFLQCFSEQRPFQGEARMRRADGEWRWVESRGQPRLGPEGEFRGYIGTSIDVTERKQAEAALREEEQRFRTLADNIAQLAWMADADGRIFWYNKRWLDYTGFTPEETLSRGWQDAHHPEHVERVMGKFMHAMAEGEPWEDTFPLRGRSGEYRWFLSRALPIHDDSGRITRWIGTSTDVTEQRAYAERLREAERQTSEFLAMLGHELRNPLAAVRSAAELVNLAEPHDHRLHRAWVVLERQSTHMTRLIDSLLEVSRIARGKVKLDQKIVDLSKVLDDVLQDRGAQLAGSGLEIDKRLPERPIWVSGDDVRLAQIFDNLLGNAIKFTEAPGRINVQLSEADGQAVARLRDTGVGIRPEMLDSIFEPFHQETQDLSRTAGGLGLGLALVKGLTELHGGGVEALSDGPGSGAEFVVRLPLAQPPSAAQPSEEQAHPSRRRILIVEDNVDAAEMLQFVLEMQGHEVLVATNGVEALELLHRAETDIVLCDIGLPIMSGYELAQEIRHDPALSELVLVALTGYGRTTDRRRTRDAGFDAHLTKPVELRALEELLATLLPSTPP